MTLTEEEAREKWCPFAREYDIERGIAGLAGVNRPTEIGARCIASQCMAWRWTVRPYGLCGLAGKGVAG